MKMNKIIRIKGLSVLHPYIENKQCSIPVAVSTECNWISYGVDLTVIVTTLCWMYN